jgi:hypothetical protein
MEGENNSMFGKPVTEENKKLISALFSKPVYLYDANSLKLINKYENHKQLIESLNISPKTIVKYKDSGKTYNNYIFSFVPL